MIGSPGLKPMRELGEMVVCVGDCVCGWVIGSDRVRLGFGVPCEESVEGVGEVGNSMNNLSLHRCAWFDGKKSFNFMVDI